MRVDTNARPAHAHRSAPRTVAAKLGITVAIVNEGSTRGDCCASIRVGVPLGEVLPVVAVEC